MLDVACGPGTVTFLAAERVGSSGKVMGIDLSTGQLAQARRHAAESGCSNVEFREMDAEALDFPDASFDVVLCSFGIQFFPRPGFFLEQAQRAMRPGGRIGVATWQRGAGVGMAGGPRLEAYLEQFGLQWSSPSASLQQPGALTAALTAAGFTAVAETSEERVQRISAEEHCQSVVHTLEMRRVWQRLSEGQRAEVRKIVLETVAGYQKEGGLELPRIAVLASGSKPTG